MTLCLDITFVNYCVMEKLVSINCSQKFDLWRSKIAEAPACIYSAFDEVARFFFLLYGLLMRPE